MVMFEGMSYDELNNLVENKRSMDYEQYFGEMDLDKDAREERIETARELDDKFLYILILLFTMQQYGGVEWEMIQRLVDAGYREVIQSHMEIDDYVDNYITGFSNDFVDSTMRNEDNPYFYSRDRGMFISENESNSMLNYKDFLTAVLSGKTKKKWVDVRDKKERKTHLMVGGTVKNITEPFLVGNSLMMFAKDSSLGAAAKEIINCRCVTRYF